MQLLIKQRVFSWSDTYDIYDEQGNQKYFVKNEFISLGHRLHVYDAAHNEIGFIKQKLFCFLPTFEIEWNGQLMGHIEKRFALFRPKYDVDFMGWRAEGDFMGCFHVCRRPWYVPLRYAQYVRRHSENSRQ